ncbi:TRASH domain-containing protein [Candidatus Woesearchaeota archaeon]|nr:TRASH domain-containing protein [Candidatus Woesearchaeota archaeon]
MAKCKFCGKELPVGTGKVLIKNDGKMFYFCSNRCQKNLLKLNRKPRNTKWTEEHQALKKGDKQQA